MEPTRWERIEALFEEALSSSDLERAGFLARACGADHSLRAEIEAMLAAAAPARALQIERMVPREPGPDPAPDPVVGTSIGPWRVIRSLGRGGMGAVYVAERSDGHYQQQAALKLVYPGSSRQDTVDRFRIERQVLARLAHRNIAKLLDGGVAPDGRPYFVMELVDGAPITDWCRSRQVSLEGRLRLFQVVCGAVQHAHVGLVVHRDLKPANILVSSTGEVKLLDFGIAKLLEPETFGLAGPATRTGEMMLTPEYAAPEQLLGGPITTTTDVYALGVVLYELLTGVRPVALEGKTPAQVERAITSGRIPPPSALAGGRRNDLDSIVLTALQPERERRYLSAAQLGEEIGRFLAGRPVQAQPDTFRYRASRFIARNPAGVIVAVAAAVFVGALWRSNQAAQRSRGEAVRALAEATAQRLQAERQTIRLLEDRGRDELERGHPFRAAVYLSGAFSRAPESLRNRELLTQAVRSMESVVWVSRHHTAAVTSIPFSPDDQRLLTASVDGTAQILEAGSGRILRTLRPPSSPYLPQRHTLTCAAFSPNGQHVVVGTVLGVLQIWNAHTGARMIELRGPREPVFSCGYSPDGRQLLTTQAQAPARLWDPEKGTVLRVLGDSGAGRGRGVFSADGRLILLSAYGGTSQVFRAADGKLLYALKQSGGPELSGELSPDGRYLAESDYEGKVRIRRAASGALVRELPHHLAVSASWSGDGRRLLTTGGGLVRVWDVDTGLGSTLYQHANQSMTRATRFVSGGDFAIALSADASLRLLSPSATGVVLDTVDLPATLTFRMLAVSRQGGRVALGSEDGTVYLVRPGRGIALAARTTKGILSVRYAPPGDCLAVGDAAGFVTVLDLKNGASRSFSAHHGTGVWRTIWSPDGQRLLTVPSSGGPNTSPKLWKMAGERATFMRELLPDPDWTTPDAAFSPGGELLVTTEAFRGAIAQVKMWDGRTGLGGERPPDRAAGVSVAMGPDGRRMALGWPAIEIWDLKTDRKTLVLAGHPNTVTGTLSFDSTGRRLVSAGYDDHLAKIWDTSSGKLLATLEGHTGRLMAARFSPDGRTVVTGAFDGTARLWEASSGDLLRTIPGPVHAVDFSPDGTKLATGIGERVIVWDVRMDSRSPEELAAHVAAHSPWTLSNGRLLLADRARPQKR